MKKYLTVLISLLLLTVTAGFCLSTEEMRVILDKNSASVGDALLVLGAVAHPGQDGIPPDALSNARMKNLDQKTPLTFGDLGVIAVEMGLCRGGLLYSLTDFSRYAAEALVFENIAPSRYTFNRVLSGEELIGFAAKLGENTPERR